MAMQKWEYCKIIGVGTKARQVFPEHRRFRQDRVEVTKIEHPEETNVAKMIANLGLDGWEMLGVVATGGESSSYIHSLYFKRPIED